MIRLPNHLESDRIGKVLVVTVTIATAGTSVFLGLMTFHDPRTLVSGDAVQTAKRASILLAARNIPLTAALLLLVGLRAWRPLGYFLALAGAEQVFDTAIFASQHSASQHSASQHKVVQTAGPACFAVALSACAAWLLRRTCQGTM